MLVSLRTAIKTGGAVVSFLATTTSVVSQAIGVFEIAGWVINWTLVTLVSWAVFASFMGWIVWGFHNRINTLEETKPSISVVPEKDDIDFYLTVQNTGEYAEFEAQVEVLEGQKFMVGLPQRYSVCWEMTKQLETQLKRGQVDSLRIAGLERSDEGKSMALRFYCSTVIYPYDVDGGSQGIQRAVGSVNSASWELGSVLISKPCFTLRITITSNPSMKEGVFSRTYQLDDRGLSEVRV